MTGAKVQSHLVNVVAGTALPGATQLQAKVDMPKAFSRAKLDTTEIDRWVFSMNLYFATLNLPEHMRAVRAALNLADKAAVWLRAKDIDLAKIMWDTPEEGLCGAFCPADLKQRTRDQLD